MMRQRLVGALVLLCLGVIVWSLLFTGSVDNRVDRETQIPPSPRIEPVLEQSPQEPEGVPSVADNRLPPQKTLAPSDEEVDGGEGVRAGAEPPSLFSETPKPESQSKPESTPKPKPEPAPKPTAKTEPERETSTTEAKSASKIDQRGLPKAWVVQVGSFGQKANADALVGKLKARGYKAFYDSYSSGGRSLYRVQVGPVIEEGRARSLKQEIDKGFAVKSIVTRFEG